MRWSRSFCLGVLALVSHLSNSQSIRADIPEFIGDGELVHRSNLIVIGRLQGDSVQKIRHPGGVGHEYHAMLIVKETLKGDSQDRKMTLMIRHGLRVDVKEGKVEIWNNAGPIHPFPLVADAGQDQIWFLRKLQSGDGQPDAPWMWGVYGSHEVQNVELLEYFKILLGPKPEPKVRDYLMSHPQLAVRAVEYLESRELKRILAEPDPAIRYQKLLPYFLRAAHYATSEATRRALIDGGPESGPYLMAAFDNLQHRRQRGEIIRILGRTGYAGCADLLVRLLDENHRDYLNLRGRLERDGPESGIDPRDVQQLAGEVRAAIYALAEIGDPRAEELVAETILRWKGISNVEPGVIEGCYSAREVFRRRSHKVR
jgi:hypothetical protein